MNKAQSTAPGKEELHTMKIRPSYCLLFALSFGLGACSQTPTKESEPSDIANEQPAPAPQPVVKEINYRPFPTSTLYSLLVAEFAAKRQQYSLALGNYIDQAHQTKDPGIVAHATHLARYLKADRAAMDAALLWVSVDPENVEANYMAAIGLTRNKQPVAALNYMAKVDSLGGKTNFTSISNYAIHLSEQIQRSLLADYEKLTETMFENADLLLAKALILAQLKENERALATVQKVLVIVPEHVQSMTLEATLLLALKRRDEAFERIGRFLQDNPSNKRLRLQYARLLTRHDLPKAQKQFSILVEQSPEDSDLIFSLALINKENNLPEKAKQRFQQLLDMNARTSEAHYYLGQMSEAEGDIATAIAHYRAVEPGIDFVPSIKNLVKLLVKKLQIDEALGVIAQARITSPQDAIRLYLIETDLLMQYKRYEAGFTLLGKALAQFPDNDNLLYARSMVSEKLGNIELLELDLRKILTRNPKSTLALNALGYTLADRTDRHQEALDLISKALAMQPQDPAIMDSMGWVQYRMGNHQEAIRILKKAHELFPDHEVAAHLGEVLWVSGHHDEARLVWQNALNKQPESEILKKIIDRFQPQLDRPTDTAAE